MREKKSQTKLHIKLCTGRKINGNLEFERTSRFFLEELVNMTNDKYRSQKLALVQKVPTPIKPITIDQTTRHITLAYFEQKSTVDYIGVVQGIPICFDAKECATDRFPLANVHEHQIRFMKEFEEQDGIAFY